MKEANLKSLISGNKNLDENLFSSFLNYYSIKLKHSEILDLECLVDSLSSVCSSDSIFDKYFVGFSIPQIGKEFDLIRIGEKDIINIELKRNSTHDKILKQLIKNKYYLNFLQKNTFNYSFISDEKKLYSLNSDEKLIEVEFESLCNILLAQNVKKISNIEHLFNPSDYLVSPFNTTDKFINGNYFLTVQQENIKNEIIDISQQNKSSFFSIKGKAGTGKTLITYDIAKHFIDLGKKVLLIHCGILNEGHRKLRQENNWDIIAAKFINHKKLSDYSLIVIDECQRVYPLQLTSVVHEIKKNGGIGVFSYDSQQYLRNWELNNNIEKLLEDEAVSKTYELTTKIRTNKEIASFIRGLFDKSKVVEKQNFSNIELNYFDNYDEALRYIYQVRQEDWKTINYTPSTKAFLPYEEHKIVNEVDNSHTIIGQEFENVIAVIDNYFYYNKNRLSTRNYSVKPYYHPTKMLYQIVTRTRKRLNIVIINNNEILERCLIILKK